MTPLRLLPNPTADDSLGIGVLTCEHGLLPLVAMSVDAHLCGLMASTTIEQTFTNSYAQPIEATYIFPLPGRAAVTAFSMTVARRRLVGALKERQVARESYDAALAAGQRAAIMEEDRPEVFTTRVGNLAPGDTAVVRLTLAGPVPCEFGEAEFRIPLVVAPRYIPGRSLEGAVGDGVALDTDAVPDASRISPPLRAPGDRNTVPLELTVRLDPGGLTIGDLSSSLHAIIDDGNVHRGLITVRLSDSESDRRLNRDFVLRYRVGLDAQDPEGALSAVTIPDDPSGGEGTVMVTIVPPEHARSAMARDVVIVLDRSGSMGGWKIVAARRAAARIIDSLTSADRFAVLAFDNVVERPPGLGSGTMASASERNRYRAVEWLGRLEARGGTEMVTALTAAQALLGANGDEERAACCVLVTDGQVGNEDQLVRLVSAAHARVYAVGIDQAVNAGLLGRLASVTGGRCDLVEAEDRLDEVLADVQRRIGHPVLESAELVFDGLRINPDTLTPSGPLDVFPGVPLVVTGRYYGAAAGTATLIGGNGFTLTTVVSTPTDTQTGPGVAKAASALWARANLRRLEDRYACLSPAQAPIRDELAKRIVEVSLAHRVLCRFTAWVAIDASGEVVKGPLRPIVQPVEAPAGWVGGGAPAQARLMSAAGRPADLSGVPVGPLAAPSSASSGAAQRNATGFGAGEVEGPLFGAGNGPLRPASGRPMTVPPSPPATAVTHLSLDERLEDLLAAVELLLSGDGSGRDHTRQPALTPPGQLDRPSVERLAETTRILARDVATAASAADLVARLGELADALANFDVVRAGELVRRIRELVEEPVRAGGRRRWGRFWR